MTLNTLDKAHGTALLIAALCSINSAQSYAGTMGAAHLTAPGTVYLGLFGGAGAANDIRAKQFATAFLIEAEGGPLAVNAFGTARSNTVGLVGGQLGYRWSEVPLTLFKSQTSITPATELEGYYLGKGSFRGEELNNETERLPEHDFLVTYPINTGVFLINAVAHLNTPSHPQLTPYVGAGIGAAILSINNADATQIAPAEPGINHYNSNTNSADATFATQVKVGLSYNLNEHTKVFGEYRWLYLASSDYTFGSTSYPTHVATSSWLVRFGSQNYNLGAVGIQYSL